MALPFLPQNRYPGSPAAAPDTGQRELLAAAKRVHSVKRRAGEDGRAARRNSLRRAKNSTEELRRTRARGGSSGTAVDTSPTAGRSFTVGNINNGIIYLRYYLHPSQLHQLVSRLYLSSLSTMWKGLLS